MTDAPAPWLIGVDGGGTQTRLALFTASDRPITIGTAGGANLRDVGVDGLANALRIARDRAFAIATLPHRPVEFTFLGLAGVATDEEKRAARDAAAVAGLSRAENIDVDHDLRVALAGGTPDGSGIVLVAGTGSGCFGRNELGIDARAGGLGPFVDDAGSAYDLGRRALVAVIRAEEGRGVMTSLRDPIFAKFEARGARDLAIRLGPHGPPRADVAALARSVLDAADAHDEVATQLLGEGAAALAPLVRSVAERLHVDSGHVITVGGLIERPTRYRDLLTAQLGEILPRFTLRGADYPPAIGALLLAASRCQPPVQLDSIRSAAAIGLELFAVDGET